MNEIQKVQIEIKLADLEMLQMLLEIKLTQLNINDQEIIGSVEELKKEINKYRRIVEKL